MKSLLSRTWLTCLPKRTLTSLVGAAARRSWSRRLIPLYIRHYGIDCADAGRELHAYSSLVDFFARELKPDARTIDATGIVSPVDGRLSEQGAISDLTLVQAKGCFYSVEALLGGTDFAAMFEGGQYQTLYLSPRDYHRIHAPVDGHIYRWRFIPGNLYPVNPLGVRYVQGLFTKNERLVSLIETSKGRCAMVMVGATIVGSIRTPYGPAYQPPGIRGRLQVLEGSVNHPIYKGEEVGWFEFGSTVILLFEPGMVDKWVLEPGNVVRMGQQIGTFSQTSLQNEVNGE